MDALRIGPNFGAVAIDAHVAYPFENGEKVVYMIGAEFRAALGVEAINGADDGGAVSM